MLRILICDPGSIRHSQLKLAVDKVVAALETRNYGTSCVSTPEDMVTIVKRMRAGFYDIIVCRIDARCCDGVFAALSSVREDGCEASIVVVADSPEYASRAISVRAEGYCLVKEGGAGLTRTMESPVGKAMARRGETVGLRTDVGIGNVSVDDILFAESSKKGAILHLPFDATMIVRGTLQGLFETLSTRDCFVKAGNSFIVNLENVRSIGEKAIIFANGESIIVPVRARKPVKDALRDYCLRKAG